MDIEEKLAKFRQTSNSKETKNTSKDIFQSVNNFLKNLTPNTDVSQPSKSINQKPTESIQINPKLQSNLKKRLITPTETENPLITHQMDLPEVQEQTPKEFRIKLIKIILKFILWATLFALFIKLEFGIVYFVCSLLVIICLNTNVGKRGPISAYSVFNPNLERLQGQITAEQLERSLISPFQ